MAVKRERERETHKKETAGSVRSHKSYERVVQSNLLGRICLAIWSEKRRKGGRRYNVGAQYKSNIPYIMDLFVGSFRSAKISIFLSHLSSLGHKKVERAAVIPCEIRSC